MTTNNRCYGCFSPTGGHYPCPICRWQHNNQTAGLHLEPGQKLHGRYVLGRVLGQGGFGITYLGWDERLNVKVAVKEYLYTQWATSLMGATTVCAHGNRQQEFAEGIRHFLDEAQTLAQFKPHFNIITVTDFFEANGTGYLVMDYEDGVTFKQYLAKQPGGTLPWRKALPIFIQIIDALRATHAVNLIHRGISPDNIYLVQNSQVKILDFGNARHYDSEQSQSLSVLLKDGYASPKQYSRNVKQGPWTKRLCTWSNLVQGAEQNNATTSFG